MYSFIVPVYNCKLSIGDVVKSIELQGLTDYEIILVDDGSTDGSGTRCDKIQAERKNISVVHKQNGGASSARNIGMQYAQGTYIIFLDADDTIDPLFIHSFECCFNADFGLLIYGMKFMYQYLDHVETVIYSNPEDEQIELAELAKDIMRYFTNNSLSSACNKVFNAALIRENNLRFNEELIVYEDLDFVLKYLACLNKQKICISNKSGYNYRISVGSNEGKNQRFSDFSLLMQTMDSINGSLALISKKTESEKKCNYLSMVIMNYFVLEYLKRSKSLSADINLVIQKYQGSNNQQIFNKLTQEEKKQLIYLNGIDQNSKYSLTIKLILIRIKAILRTYRNRIKAL